MAVSAATAALRARPVLGSAIAVATATVAFLARLGLDDVLPPGFPYLTFFPAVILTTFFCGLRPGIVCAVLSGLAAWYMFVPPRESFALDGSTALTLIFYVFIVSVDIALIHLMHRAGEHLLAERAVSAALYDRQRTMFQELQHRVANNMQFVAALLTLQKRKVNADPATATAALDEARVRLETISRLHRRLYDPSRLDLPVGQYLQELCDDLLEAAGAGHIRCRAEAVPVRFDIARLTTLSLLVAEIVTNALKHAFAPGQPGTITVRLDAPDSGRIALTIADDGRGLPANFDPEGGRSLGLRISQGLAGQLGGRLDYASQGGTTVRVVFARGDASPPVTA